MARTKSALPRPAYERRAAGLKRRIRREFGRGGQTRVARHLGMSRQYLYNILAGRYTSNPALDRVERYLNSLTSTDSV